MCVIPLLVSWDTLRIPGVLQRLAWSYLVVACLDLLVARSHLDILTMVSQHLSFLRLCYLKQNGHNYCGYINCNVSLSTYNNCRVPVLNVFLHKIKVYLCFAGCLVVSWTWHLALLACMALCSPLRNHLAMPHFPSSCTRLPNVSLGMFECTIHKCFWVHLTRTICQPYCNETQYFKLSRLFHSIKIYSENWYLMFCHFSKTVCLFILFVLK